MSARVIADSMNPGGQRITTLQLRYWRAVHAELLTHRSMSRNASSSRAIPVRKVLAQVWHDPAGPEHWGVNQAGMQALTESEGWLLLQVLKDVRDRQRTTPHRDSLEDAIAYAALKAEARLAEGGAA